MLLDAYNPTTDVTDPSITPITVDPSDGTITPLTEEQTAPAMQNGTLETGEVKRNEDGMIVPDMTELKIELERSSDNQGRVTIYQVEVLG
jgi:hypothetical protein